MPLVERERELDQLEQGLELIELKEDLRRRLVEKYREKFRDEEPIVTHGLHSKQANLVYPIVSDIPVMLVDEAIPASEAR